MKKVLLTLIFAFTVTSTWVHAQGRAEEGNEAVELPCFTIKDTIRINLPKGYEKGNIFWYGEGFIQSFKLGSGADIIIICGSQHQMPALLGKNYIVTQQEGRKRKGKIKKTNLLWREEDFLGFIVYYTNAKESEKEMLDSIIDTISAQVEKK